jgi:hypothetical protein
VTTPTSGSAPDRTKLTQVGRARARLGVEHIVGFSPQALGRNERANGTLQDRLANELRLAGSAPWRRESVPARALHPRVQRDVGRAPVDSHSAFVPIVRDDLTQILCYEEERVVARDNTVTLERVVLQIDKQRRRCTCAGLRVLIRRHLDRQHSMWWGPRSQTVAA